MIARCASPASMPANKQPSPTLSGRSRTGRGSSILKKVCADGILRVGFNEARPWSYTSLHGVLGRDIATCRALAASLKVTLELLECRHEDLASRVINGDVDLAVGGLLDQRQSGISCIPVQRGRYIDTGLAGTYHYRRAFYPNVWWIGERDLVWNVRIRAFLLGCHLRATFPMLAGRSCFEDEHRPES